MKILPVKIFEFIFRFGESVILTSFHFDTYNTNMCLIIFNTPEPNNVHFLLHLVVWAFSALC